MTIHARSALAFLVLTKTHTNRICFGSLITTDYNPSFFTLPYEIEKKRKENGEHFWILVCYNFTENCSWFTCRSRWENLDRGQYRLQPIREFGSSQPYNKYLLILDKVSISLGQQINTFHTHCLNVSCQEKAYWKSVVHCTKRQAKTRQLYLKRVTRT